MSRFIICRASAGSGKTYTLVRQYIEIAISSPSQLENRFRHILAITFTNKAANGMKQRIVSQLAKIVGRAPDTEGLVSEMAAHLGIDADETVRRCAVLHSSIMHHYSDFAVSTIDSFVHRLVRTFAHDLRLPLNFNVLIDNQEIIDFSVDELLSQAGTDGAEPLTRVLCDFSQRSMEDGKSYKIESQIADIAHEVFKEEAPRFLERIKDFDFDYFRQLDAKWRKDNGIFEQRVASAARDAIAVCDAQGLSENDFPYKGTGVYGYFSRFASGDFKNINKTGSRVTNAFASGVLYAKSAPKSTQQAIAALTPQLTQCYERICKILDDGLPLYNTRQMLFPRLYSIALLGKIRQIKEQYYKDSETVHISEFNKRIAAEIADQPTPFIYERIGARYYNYLIDEFQDTSRLQWQNFLPLIDEAMSHSFSADTAEPGTQSLVVGDGKQAIYRFRQGDVRQFINLPNVDSPLHGASLRYNSRIDNLDCNYRTLSNIVEFNNAFFEWAVRTHFSHNADLTSLYLDPAAAQKSVGKGGYVSVGFVDGEALLQTLLDSIRHQVEEQGYRHGDIMVLARDNKTLVRISEFLVANAVPVVSSESFILSNSKVVLLLFSLLKHMVSPADRVVSLQVLQYCTELGCLPADSDCCWQLRESGYSLETVLRKYGIDINTEYLKSLSLYDCCEQLLRHFRLQGLETSYVATFLGCVATFTQRHHSDMADFITWFEPRIDTQSSSTSADMDAVKLMTVHKAKGLEEKIVIYMPPVPRTHTSTLWVNVPDGNDLGLPVALVSAKKDTDTIFDSEFAEEERLTEMDNLNLLYVALTRPKEKLFVICTDMAKDDGNDGISLLYKYAQSQNFNGDSFVIGTDFPNPDKQGSDKPDTEDGSLLPATNVVFSSWENRIGIAARSQSLLSPFDLDSRRYGILVHDLLSHIATAADIDPVVDAFCESHNHDSLVADGIKTRIRAMVEKEENRKFFSPGCGLLREASLVVGGQLRRPDRIVLYPDCTWVVDFKTGAYSDESHKRYQQQVDEYVAAVAAMGYPNVRGAILYC